MSVLLSLFSWDKFPLRKGLLEKKRSGNLSVDSVMGCGIRTAENLSLWRVSEVATCKDILS